MSKPHITFWKLTLLVNRTFLAEFKHIQPKQPLVILLLGLWLLLGCDNKSMQNLEQYNVWLQRLWTNRLPKCLTFSLWLITYNHTTKRFKPKFSVHHRKGYNWELICTQIAKKRIFIPIILSWTWSYSVISLMRQL